MNAAPEVAIGLNAVIVAVTDEVPRILTVAARGDEGTDALDRPLDALSYGPLDPRGHRTLERGLREWVREQTGLELGYVEQLYTFGDQHRDPAERGGGPRVVSVAYLALAHEAAPSAAAHWRGWYEYFPWEDWRAGRLPLLDREIAPALARWAAAGAAEVALRRQRRERVDLAFGLGGAPWDAERVLERYELLYEAGLVSEARHDRRSGADASKLPARDGRGEHGRPMALDHRRILAVALGRLRGKLRYRPVVFELLPPTFTLLQLQRVVEALAGVRLHKQNFRRLVEKGGLVEGTGDIETRTGGRPAELFRFRREVLRERPAPGVALPSTRR